MADEQTDTSQEQEQEQESSDSTSEVNWEARAKHSQSIADKRDATNKSLQAELDALKATQKKAEEDSLKENDKFKELYERGQSELAAAQAAAQKASLQVELHTFLAEKYPDFAPDSKWIMPHVTSKEEIASVVEDYVKAHPKAAGVGAAGNMGNGGKEGGGETISAADLDDPTTLSKKLDEDPKLAEKLASGEIKLI